MDTLPGTLWPPLHGVPGGGERSLELIRLHSSSSTERMPCSWVEAMLVRHAGEQAGPDLVDGCQAAGVIDHHLFERGDREPFGRCVQPVKVGCVEDCSWRRQWPVLAHGGAGEADDIDV